MARLTDLIATLATETGQREQGLTQLARHLREGGLIRQGGRGRGAAQMGPTDAANLLLGLLASDQWQDAPDRVRHAREATFNGYERNYDGKVRDDPPPLPFLLDASGAVRPLGDALDAMLAEMMNGDLLRQNGFPVENIDIVVTRPGLQCSIEVRGEPTLFVHFNRSDPRFDGVPHEEWDALARKLYPLSPNLTITASVGYGVLAPLAECIAEGPR